MAGIIGIYGLVVSVLISDNLVQELPLFNAFIQLGAGLSVGLAGLAAGFVTSKRCVWIALIKGSQICNWYCR